LDEQRVDWLKGPPFPKPLFVFGIFSVTNALLAYTALPYAIKGWLLTIGLVIPFTLHLLQKGSSNPKDLFHVESFSRPIPTEFWIGGIGVAVALRFFKLTNLYLWPTGDEGLHGFLALQLLRHWDLRFFYTVGEHPPLLIWSLALFFKIFDSPFFNLWFLPAVFSSLTFPMGYWAARTLFSRSLSLMYGGLLAFSFWPLYAGRFCHQSLFIPFLELLSFYLAAKLLKRGGGGKSVGWFLALGLVLCLGTFTFTSWAVILALLTLTFLFVRPGGAYKTFFQFILVLCAALIPFLAAVEREGYGRHLMDSAAVNSDFSASHQLLTHLSYLSCLFWGPLQPGTSYGPLWGGMLNPLLGGAFLLGLLALCAQWPLGMSRWLLLALVLCLSPAFFASDYVELNRIIQAMPVLLMITALWLQELLLSLKKEGTRKFALLGLGFLSFFLDFGQLLKPALEGPPPSWHFKTEMSDGNFRAYQVLDRQFREKGKGIILTDFLPLKYGHTLYVACYHLNALMDTGPVHSPSSWAAVATNINYQPFLATRFPGAQWYEAGEEGHSRGGDLMVGLIPVDPADRGTIDRWTIACEAFHQLQIDAEGSYNSQRAFQSSFQDLSRTYPLVEGDPFLESCYWEWAAQYYYSPSFRENLEALRRAVGRGYPAAHLFDRLGSLLAQESRMDEAAQAFRAADKVRPSFSTGPDGLILGKDFRRESLPSR
jgi:hypothetical protein